jgi:hypothetical protein
MAGTEMPFTGSGYPELRQVRKWHSQVLGIPTYSRYRNGIHWSGYPDLWQELKNHSVCSGYPTYSRYENDIHWFWISIYLQHVEK